MYYKIKFSSNSMMWDFIDAYIRNDYAAINTTNTLQLNTLQYNKMSTLQLASHFGGVDVDSVMYA